MPKRNRNNNNLKNNKFYSKVAMNMITKTMQYITSCKTYNKKTKEYSTFNFDMEWHFKQTFLYSTFVLDDLNYQATQKNYTPIFVTLTLPSRYQPSSKFYQGHSVEDGYKKLIEVFRHLQNSFRVNNKRVDHKFFRVVEPHKSFIPHLHAIIWIPSDTVEHFKSHFSNTIKLFKFNSRGQDLKVLEVAKYAVVYLMKYVRKTLDGNNATIMGWKSYHKIRQISSSRSIIPRMIFKKLSQYVPYDKDNDLPYIHQIKEKVTFNIRTINRVNEVIRETEILSVDALYHVSYDRLRTECVEYEPLTYCIFDRNPITFDKIVKYKYKLLDYDITDLTTFELLYSSKDYIFLAHDDEIPDNEIFFDTSSTNHEFVKDYGYGDGDNFIEYEIVEYIE